MTDPGDHVRRYAHLAQQLDVIEGPAAAEDVLGNVHHVVRLVVRPMDLEHVDGSIDVPAEA